MGKAALGSTGKETNELRSNKIPMFLSEYIAILTLVIYIP
jgi:hypothetical protein